MSVASDQGSVRAAQAAHFGRLAADWWDPRGSSAPLHKLNPPRLRYVREQVDHRWRSDPRSFAPLAGKRVADVGCGAGLLAEPLARLGAEVVGVDASAEVIEAARAHAMAGGLAIDYRTGGVEALAGERFDLVTSLEVVEHTADPARFVRGLAGLMAEDGLLILSTPNRTGWSRLVMITLAEGTGRIPRGTHEWERFVTPAELTRMMEEAGLRVQDVRGLAWNLSRGFELSASTELDYFVTAVRA